MGILVSLIKTMHIDLSWTIKSWEVAYLQANNVSLFAWTLRMTINQIDFQTLITKNRNI